MRPKRAPAALEQHIEIAARLRRFHHAEARAMRRDRQILGVVRGDLQKHAAVRPAFVGLAGRMQKARAEFETGRDMAPVAHREPRLLQGRGVGIVARDIGQHGKIVAGADAAEMRLEPAIERRAGAGGAQRLGVGVVGIKVDGFAGKRRRLGRQRAGLLERGRQFAGLDLAGFDVGLIERIDADDRAGDGSRDLEAEEFLADMFGRFQLDAHHRMAGRLQRRELGLVSGIGSRHASVRSMKKRSSP